MRIPRPTRISVMVKRTLSYSPRILARPPIGQPPHRRLEDPSSLFKVLEHIETGTGRREEHHIPRGRIPGCSLDRLLEARDRLGGTDTGEHRRELLPRPADENGRLDPLFDQRDQGPEVGPLVQPTRDQDHRSRRKPLDGLHGSPHVGPLGVVEVPDPGDLRHQVEPRLGPRDLRGSPPADGLLFGAYVSPTPPVLFLKNKPPPQSFSHPPLSCPASG